MIPAPALRLTIEDDGDLRRVRFAGEIDENADLSSLRPLLAGRVEFELSGVTRVNSCGVREWVNFVRDLPAVDRLDLVACSPAIVAQLCTIYNFRGPAHVRSLLAPYVCEGCGVEELRPIELGEAVGGSLPVPSFSCARCGGPMEFDDLPERYLFLLREA